MGSYFLPINIYSTKSAISKTLEVTWANGELVLDSANTNYSYGSLQRILKYGLENIGFEKIKQMNEILVLGVAGGSVIKTLVEDIKFTGAITGVEIDAEIITLANEHFKLNEIPNLQIIIDDAFEFVLKTTKKYDLILIDIFQDTTMPAFLFESFFTKRICFLLKQKGFVLFNTMILDEPNSFRNKKYLADFKEPHFSMRTLPRVEQHNELIIIESVAL
ncbi:fused MFS/spermidine synthase [Flavobacterium sp.]|uniref:spermidine synthase n=1 Tax=Flavobacterium sp. TaxID=239 RepID=UPI0026305FFE|nr:fused MFS/spermidine synthase [Flavobacterium sp.]MDG2432559.1 fused MFS/spermidine synthase [Flavobacterium sp.]